MSQRRIRQSERCLSDWQRGRITFSMIMKASIDCQLLKYVSHIGSCTVVMAYRNCVGWSIDISLRSLLHIPMVHRLPCRDHTTSYSLYTLASATRYSPIQSCSSCQWSVSQTLSSLSIHVRLSTADDPLRATQRRPAGSTHSVVFSCMT